MWTVIKFDKKYLKSLKKDFSEKLNNGLEFYVPKIKIQKNANNKLCNNETLLLGNYLLCFHESFSNPNIINTLRYCKGVKYFLNDFLNSQDEITEFVKKCKLNENNEGYIKQSFFDFKNIKRLKFISGPFTNMIFNLISESDTKIKAQIDNFKITVSKNSYLFRPV